MILALGVSLLAVGWLFLYPSRLPDPEIFYWCVAGAFVALALGKQRAKPIIPRGWVSWPAAILLIIFYFAINGGIVRYRILVA